ALADRRRRRAGAVHLLRPAFPRALPDPRRARRPRARGAGGVHAAHHARSLGGVDPGTRDREPGVCGRRQPGRYTSGRPPLGRALDDRRPVGSRARAGARQHRAHPRRARSRAPARDPRAAAGARQPSNRGIPLARGGTRMSSTDRAPSTRSKAAPEKRRLILDAAVRVFARQGFHACRVSDIADEAGVAYGLVYHYFASKDEVLDTLFLERWDVMLE